MCALSPSCPTLCDPMDCSPPGASVLGILQTKILEWVVYPFSRGFSRPRNQTRVFCILADSFPAELPGKPRESGRVCFKSLLFFWYYRPHFPYLRKAINNKDLKRLRRLSTQSTQHASRCDNNVGCFPLHLGFSLLLC